jgi:hypothetical protein
MAERWDDSPEAQITSEMHELIASVRSTARGSDPALRGRWRSLMRASAMAKSAASSQRIIPDRVHQLR